MWASKPLFNTEDVGKIGHFELKGEGDDIKQMGPNRESNPGRPV